MKTINIEFEKEVTKIMMPFAVCDCGYQMILKGSNNCVHADYISYVYQCPSCKNIEFSGYPIESETEEFLINAGWKRVVNIKSDNQQS